MIAKSLAKNPTKPVDLTVPKFDWDAHHVFEASVADLIAGTDDIPHYSEVVGIDTGRKFPTPALVCVESKPGFWIANEEAYFKRYNTRWNDDHDVPFKPYWTEKSIFFVMVGNTRFEANDTNVFRWVATKTRSQLEAERASGKTQVSLSGAERSRMRKREKAARDREYRNRMKGHNPAADKGRMGNSGKKR